MSRFQRRSPSLAAWAVAFAVGCGGGQQSSATARGAAHTTKAGSAVITYFGQPKPMSTTSSSSVSVAAQAGATYSSITLEPPPNLADTYLVVSRNVGGFEQLYEVPYSTGVEQPLYQSVATDLYPGISAYGTIAFESVIGSSFTLQSIRNDGTGLKAITTSDGAFQDPAYSVDGTNRLALASGDQLLVAPGTGGTVTSIQSNDAAYGHAWSPSGSQIAYSVGVSNDTNDIFESPSGGGTAQDITPGNLVNTGRLAYPSWNADGVSLSATYSSSGSSTSSIMRFATNYPDASVDLTPEGDSDTFSCFSPDGSKIAIYRTNANSATAGIYISDTNLTNQRLFLADPSGLPNSITGGMAWSPFLPKETVVAASGSTFYHGAASGFLLSQVGSQFGSVVAFTATTPSTAAIQTPAPSSGTAPLLFTLTADSITEVGFTNSYFGPGTVLTLSSTPTVLVSVDAATGQVDLVSPAAAKPSTTNNADGTVTYRGKFTALYNCTGANVGPHGVSSLTVDPRNGRLVRFAP